MTYHVTLVSELGTDTFECREAPTANDTFIEIVEGDETYYFAVDRVYTMRVREEK